MSNWLRPGAGTSPERLFCHVYGLGKGQAQMTSRRDNEHQAQRLVRQLEKLGYTVQLAATAT